MDLTKLSTALAPVNLADTTDIIISPTFTLRVCQMINYNQVYNQKLEAFAKNFPSHQFVKNFKAFISDWYSAKQTPDTVSFMAHVILCGWSLTDDEGRPVEFSPANAVALLQAPIGRAIFGKISNAVQSDAHFQLEWTEDAVKNS